MSRTRRIAELERRLQEQHDRLTLLSAEIAGTRAELDALRRGLGVTEDLASMSFTEAVVTVLNSGASPMRTPQLKSELRKVGRSETDNAFSATLSYLVKQGRIVRAGRGLYAAT